MVTGDGAPTAGFVYKMVATADRPDAAGHQRPVAKLSPGKATIGGRKWAWRLLDDGLAGGQVAAREAAPQAAREEVATDPYPPATPARPLQVDAVLAGEVVHRPTLQEIRAHYLAARAELPPATPLTVTTRGEPA